MPREIRREEVRKLVASGAQLVVDGRVDPKTGRAFTVGEVQVEDALGRTVVTATGSVVVRPKNPAPPPLPSGEEGMGQ